MSTQNKIQDNNELNDNPLDGKSGSDTKAPAPKIWKGYQKVLFRIAFVFFLLMSLPLTGGWYRNVATLDWLHPHYRDIYDIARFSTGVRSFFGLSGGRAGLSDEDGVSASGAADQNGRSGARRKAEEAGGRRDSARSERGGAGGERRRRRAGDEKSAGFASAEGRQRRAERGEGFHRRGDAGADSAIAGGERRNGEGFAGRRNRGQDSVGNRRERPAEFASAEGGRRGGFRGRRNRLADSTTGAAGENRPRFNRDSGRAGREVAANGERRGRRSDFKRDSSKIDSLERDTTGKGAGFAARGNGGNGSGAANAIPRSRGWWTDYTDWFYALGIATIAGLIWSLVDRKRKEYNVLYYVIKVVVRYRAAIGIIGFGFTKLFPTQMPFSSLGLLNTDFGDFTGQKIYWMSVGMVPWYQVFGGVVELLAGGLLLFRRTATLGAILLIGALGDITFVNYSYDGGVHVYAFYFVLLGLFVIVDDIPRIYNLLIREKYTVPNSYYPVYTNNWIGYTRIGLKTLTFLIFFVILTYTEVINFKYDPYKQPSTAGIKALRGNYNVTEFRINDKVFPYDPTDSVRWQQATFENWTTLTFKINRPVVVDPSNGGGSPMRDIQRTFEIAGTAGGQRAFHYYADTIDKVLYLQDKNALAARGSGGRGGRGLDADSENDPRRYPKDWISKTAWKHIGDENKMIDPRAYSTRRDREFARPERPFNRAKMILTYDTKDGSHVVLKGLNENRDSIYVVLDRVDRKYVLSKSSLNAGKY